MRNLIPAFFLAVLLSTSMAPGPVYASPAQNASKADILRNEIVLDFPETATFQLSLTNAVEITSVVLEYGNEQQTCGEVIAKAFPAFTPGTDVDAQWTWEMRQSGSLPPGAQLWWRWRLTDANGNETVTETKTATWLDDEHNWKTVNVGEYLRLHYYEGSQAFISDLSSAADQGLQFNESQSGLTADSPIDIFIYADVNDLKDATLYEPSWIGGRAFSEYDIVIIGISESNLAWGRNAMIHELTHVLIGDLTFSCLGDVPTWLNEGLAVFSEGMLDKESQDQLEQAIRDDTLMSIRSLSGNFSELPDKVSLSYSQSYSISKYLIETYGQDKMTDLLVALREGVTIDEALMQTYGFDTDGLEDAWRQAIGAQPRPVSAQPTARAAPTFVPTIVPLSGGFQALQTTPTPIPTSTGGQPTTTPQDQTGPPLALTLVLLGMCCLFLLVIGVVVLGFVVRNQNIKAAKNEQ